MKTFLLFTFFFLTIQYSFGQDKIFTKAGEEINAVIHEQSPKWVTYKMIDYLDGPAFSLKTHQIERIEYKNGYIVDFGSQNPRLKRPLGISTGTNFFFYEEGGYILVNMDYFISSNWDLLVSVGSDFDDSFLSFGSRYHFSKPNSNNKLTPFTGLLFGAEYGDSFFRIPVGVNYVSKKGFNAAFSLSELVHLSNPWQGTFIELTLGWRFK